MIRVKRVYATAAASDGARFLVDQLWPRGLKKDLLKLDGWLREVAPSSTLRKWFGHEAAKWPEFQRRYFAELDDKPETLRPLLQSARQGDLTLLFGARDEEHNNAVALKSYLDRHLKTRRLQGRQHLAAT